MFERQYDSYVRYHKKCAISKDACRSCKWEKRREANIVNYGYANPAQSPEKQEKRKNTLLKRYGFENPFQVEEFKQKQRSTMLERYGYEYNSQIPQVKKNKILKMIKTKHENGNAPCSSQQKYLHNILGGKLNFPVDNLWLDIAFPEELLYVEYNGSGHDLDVQMGKIGKEMFDRKEMSRYYFLKKIGWKMIEISSKSKYDLVPKENILIDMISFSRDYLREFDGSWIKFDIDNGKVITNNFSNDYDFRELIRTHKK